MDETSQESREVDSGPEKVSNIPEVEGRGKPGQGPESPVCTQGAGDSLVPNTEDQKWRRAGRAVGLKGGRTTGS